VEGILLVHRLFGTNSLMTNSSLSQKFLEFSILNTSGGADISQLIDCGSGWMTGNPCYLECGFVGIREEPIQRETVCFGEVQR